MNNILIRVSSLASYIRSSKMKMKLIFNMKVKWNIFHKWSIDFYNYVVDWLLFCVTQSAVSDGFDTSFVVEYTQT